MVNLTSDRVYAQNYFNFIANAQSLKDENDQFAKGEIPEPAESRELLKSFDQLKGHQLEAQSLFNLCKTSLKNCAPHLRAGFNFLCYGVGRKQELLDQIVPEFFDDFNVFTITGYSEVSINLGPVALFNCLLNTIQKNIFPGLENNFNTSSASKAAIISKTDLICRQNSQQRNLILIHQFDSPAFRSPVIFDCLLKLVNVAKFSLIASIDNPGIVNLFSKSRFEKFNWLWMDCTTMQPYTEELNRFALDACTNSASKQTPRAAVIVIQSLTSNSRSIFKLLAAHQLATPENQVASLIDSFEDEEDQQENASTSHGNLDGYSGMSYHGLFQKCQENFVVTAEANFRTQLTEFTDHDLFKSLEGRDELPQVNSFNNLLGNLLTPDGSRLQLRLEVYTCKAAGNDKRLLKQLANKFVKEREGHSNESAGDSEDLESSLPTNSSNTILNSINGISLKTFYFLISTMNNMFPDYDFSDLPSEVFTRITSLPNLITHFNTSIFNTGINRNTNSFADLTRQIWDCMNEAVGGLEESEIFSFDPATESFEIDDPFRERGTIWYLRWTKLTEIKRNTKMNFTVGLITLILSILIAYSTAKNFWSVQNSAEKNEMEIMSTPAPTPTPTTTSTSTTTSTTTFAPCINGCTFSIGTSNGPNAPPPFNTNYNGRNPMITSYPTTQP